MSVWTTQPGVQLYVPNSGRTVPGKNGQQYGPRQSFCLETQHFANSPNIPAFPSTELRPGKIFYEVTEFRFQHFKVIPLRFAAGLAACLTSRRVAPRTLNPPPP
jgi:galactose mutarotase-like enzyme